MSRMSVVVGLVFIVTGLASGSGVSSEFQEFEERLAEAEENLYSEGGAAFDKELSSYFKDSKSTLDALNTCMESNIPKSSLTGYVYFPPNGGYSLEVRPVGAFATCIRGAFSGREVPEPPRRPYVNQFGFNVSN
ncbi:MAG: hypothetical protein OMOMHJEC_03347 [Xanthomonadales bacterium]|nr:hypothetical protein [Xanthomonadales bacterium]